MSHSAAQDYDLATSPILYSLLRFIGDSDGSFETLIRKSKRKKGTVSVLLGILKDHGVITITPEKLDNRKKKYTINQEGMKKYFIRWLEEKEPQSADMKDLLRTEPSFDKHFKLFFSSSRPFQRLEDQFFAFIYLHARLVEFTFHEWKNAKKDPPVGAVNANRVRVYMIAALTQLDEQEIDQYDGAFSLMDFISTENRSNISSSYSERFQ